jgi:hypothetical protein
VTDDQKQLIETMARGGVDSTEGPYCVTSTGEYLYPKASDLQAICAALLDAQAKRVMQVKLGDFRHMSMEAIERVRQYWSKAAAALPQCVGVVVTPADMDVTFVRASPAPLESPAGIDVRVAGGRGIEIADADRPDERLPLARL